MRRLRFWLYERLRRTPALEACPGCGRYVDLTMTVQPGGGDPVDCCEECAKAAGQLVLGGRAARRKLKVA